MVGYYGDLASGEYYSTLDQRGRDKKFHKTVTANDNIEELQSKFSNRAKSIQGH